MQHDRKEGIFAAMSKKDSHAERGGDMKHFTVPNKTDEPAYALSEKVDDHRFGRLCLYASITGSENVNEKYTAGYR